MITASSSRFSRSIRKYLKQRRFGTWRQMNKIFWVVFLVCCVTFGLALPASEASVLSWLPALQSVSVCSKKNTHRCQFQPDSLWKPSTFNSMTTFKSCLTFFLCSTWKASSNQTPSCQCQFQTCYILLMMKWINYLTVHHTTLLITTAKKNKAKSSTLKYGSIPFYASWFWETYLDTLIMNKKDMVQSLSSVVWTFLMKTLMVWSDENIQFRLTLTQNELNSRFQSLTRLLYNGSRRPRSVLCEHLSYSFNCSRSNIDSWKTSILESVGFDVIVCSSCSSSWTCSSKFKKTKNVKQYNLIQ